MGHFVETGIQILAGNIYIGIVIKYFPGFNVSFRLS